MRAQHANANGIYTPLYAALIAVLNTKLPLLGQLLITRLVIQFQNSFRRNDKPTCLSTCRFLAQLFNYGVAHELVILQILALVLDRVTDDGVEVAVGILKECGRHLAELSPKALHAVFERLRHILHESAALDASSSHAVALDKRTQYMIEVLFQIRRDGFAQYPTRSDPLDLVEDQDQIVHCIGLDDEDLNPEEGVDVFKWDEHWDDAERKYDAIRKEILGDEDELDEPAAHHDSTQHELPVASSDGEHASSEPEPAPSAHLTEQEQHRQLHQHMTIQDETQTNLINLRRTIYLIIMSSLSFEEATHKLLQLKTRSGTADGHTQALEEQVIVSMLVECCSQERSFEKFYGAVGERLCRLRPSMPRPHPNTPSPSDSATSGGNWAICFGLEFQKIYDELHRYETNRIRNMAKFFAHLFGTDALSWRSMHKINLTETTTTSSSRIFVKILFQELVEIMGLKAIKQRMVDLPELELDVGGTSHVTLHLNRQQRQVREMREWVSGMVGYGTKEEPCEPRDVRFRINFWTSVGLGPLTERMREALKNGQVGQRHRLSGGSEGSSDRSVSDSESESDGSSRSRGRSRRSSRSSRPSSRSSSSSSSRSSRSRSGSRSRQGRARRSSSMSSSSSRTPPRPRPRDRSTSRSPARRSTTRDRSLSPRSKRIAMMEAREGRRVPVGPRRRSSSPRSTRKAVGRHDDDRSRSRSRSRNRSRIRSRNFSRSRSRSRSRDGRYGKRKYVERSVSRDRQRRQRRRNESRWSVSRSPSPNRTSSRR